MYLFCICYTRNVITQKISVNLIIFVPYLKLLMSPKSLGSALRNINFTKRNNWSLMFTDYPVKALPHFLSLSHLLPELSPH